MNENEPLRDIDPDLTQSAGEAPRAPDGRFVGSGKARERPSSGRREKHGIGALRRMVVQYLANEEPLTVEQLDGRTRMGKVLAELRRDLIEEQGGQDAVTTQMELLIARVVTDELLLGSLDAYLTDVVMRGAIVDRDKNDRLALAPLVRERAYLADCQTRRLIALGLERKVPKRRSLSDLAREARGAGAPAASVATVATTARRRPATS